MTRQTLTPDFIAENKSIESLYGLPLVDTSLSFDLFKTSFDKSSSIDDSLVQFDYKVAGEIGLGLELNRPTFGKISINYPVETQLDLPEPIQDGGNFNLILTNNFASLGPQLSEESLNFGELNLDLILGIDPGGITNIAFKVLGTSLSPDFDLTFPGLETDNYTLLTLGPDVGASLELINGVTLTAELPRGQQNEEVGADRSADGTLETLTVSVEETIASVEINFLQLASNYPPLKSLNYLEGDYSTSVLGYDASFDYTLISLMASGGYGLVETVSFDPDSVIGTIDISGQRQTAGLGNTFSFTAPEVVSGPLEGTISYQLTGNVGVSLELAPIGSISAEVLSASASISGNGLSLGTDIGPIFSGELSKAADFGRITLFKDTIDVGPDLFVPVSFDFSVSPEGVLSPPRPTPGNPQPTPGNPQPTPGNPQPTPNMPPVAAADAATTSLATPIAIDVLANDTDADGTLVPASVAVVTAASVGIAVARNDGTVFYTPEDDPSVGGPEGYTTTFAYTVADNDGAVSPSAPVTVTVRNAPPAAVVDAARTDTATPVVIRVLDNDTDDGDALDLSSVAVTVAPTIGMTAVQDDGTVLYTPENDIFAGGPEGYTAAFSYTVADSRGAVSAPAVVTVTVERVFDQLGTAGPDRLRGNGFGDDKINGLEGNDEIDGGFGTDLVYGAGGDDTLQGGPDRDRVEGGDGNDLLDGGFGDDVINGGEGRDELRGGFGADVLDGGAGADLVLGEGGSDRLVFLAPNVDGVIDTYDGGDVGGEDVDTLVLMLHQADFNDLFQNEVAAFRDTFDEVRGGYVGTFDFASLGLVVKGFERTEINVEGEKFFV